MNYIPPEKEQETALENLPILEEVIKGFPDWITVPLLLSIVSRETQWGHARAYRPDSMKGTPNGKGDYSKRPAEVKAQYHGFGFFQIDIAAHPAFVSGGEWNDVLEAGRYVCKKVLVLWFNYLSSRFPKKTKKELIQGAIASYNCGGGNVRAAWKKGLHCDTHTAKPKRNYSRDVLDRMEFWKSWYSKKKLNT